MNKIIGIFIISYCLVSCNNAATDTTKSTTNLTTEQQLRAAIAQYPDSILLKEKLIQHLEDVDNIDMAIAEIDKALLKDSMNARFWFKKGDLHYNNEDTAAAKSAYLKSIEIYPDPTVIMTLGSVYAQTKNDSALHLADALIMGSKSNASKEALFIKGLYYNEKGEKMKAIDFFNQCLKQDYTYMFAYREKAIALYDMGKYEDALTTLDRAVTLQNTFDEGYYWMGKCYEKQNKINDAIESYKAAVLINAEYTEATDALKRLKAM